jgi:NADPH-dependent curcumin reductase CurA
MNHTILLNKTPVGRPELTDFNLVKEEKPQIQSAKYYLRTSYVSVSLLKGRMKDARKSYIPPFELNKPISSRLLLKL